MTHLPVIQTVTVHEGAEACAMCKGACCKHVPGETAPRQWMRSGEIDWERVERAFLSGKWVIDWWEGDPRYDDYGYDESRVSCAPYIRPRHSTSKEGLYDNLFFAQGDCLFLTESGCTLPETLGPTSSESEYERPAGCAALVAKLVEKNGEFETECDYPDGKQFKREAATLWIPYSERLFEVAQDAASKMRDRKEQVA